MNEPTPRVPEHPLVAKLVQDPANPPRLSVLRGYLGRSTRDGHARLYTGIELDAYVEFRADAILHVESEPASAGSHEANLVWLAADTQVTSSAEADSGAAYLGGDIASAYLEPAGWSPSPLPLPPTLVPSQCGPCTIPLSQCGPCPTKQITPCPICPTKQPTLCAPCPTKVITPCGVCPTKMITPCGVCPTKAITPCGVCPTKVISQCGVCPTKAISQCVVCPTKVISQCGVCPTKAISQCFLCPQTPACPTLGGCPQTPVCPTMGGCQTPACPTMGGCQTPACPTLGGCQQTAQCPTLGGCPQPTLACNPGEYNPEPVVHGYGDWYTSTPDTGC
jgi:hypothetical protein